MILKELEKIKKNPSFLGMYIQGMGMLSQSGIFEVLKELAQPRMLENGKDVQTMAAQAARSAGFYECLDCLLNFKDKFLADYTTVPKALYGANEAAVFKGDLTQEELDAIESGSKPDYSKLTKSTAKAATDSSRPVA